VRASVRACVAASFEISFERVCVYFHKIKHWFIYKMMALLVFITRWMSAQNGLSVYVVICHQYFMDIYTLWQLVTLRLSF